MADRIMRQEAQCQGRLPKLLMRCDPDNNLMWSFDYSIILNESCYLTSFPPSLLSGGATNSFPFMALYAIMISETLRSRCLPVPRQFFLSKVNPHS